MGIDKTAEQLLMMTQYFDTMQNAAQEGRSNVLLMPSNPSGLGEMTQEIRNTLFAANASEEAADTLGFQGDNEPQSYGYATPKTAASDTATRASMHRKASAAMHRAEGAFRGDD